MQETQQLEHHHKQIPFLSKHKDKEEQQVELLNLLLREEAHLKIGFLNKDSQFYQQHINQFKVLKSRRWKKLSKHNKTKKIYLERMPKMWLILNYSLIKKFQTRNPGLKTNLRDN